MNIDNPALWTPVSWNLANCTFPTLNQNTTGKSAKTDALNSATTVVNVSSATAPTSWQVLTATSSTAATWQTPTGWWAKTIYEWRYWAGSVPWWVTIDEFSAWEAITLWTFRVSIKTLQTTSTLDVNLQVNGSTVATASITTWASATNSRYVATDTTFTSASVAVWDRITITTTSATFGVEATWLEYQILTA